MKISQEPIFFWLAIKSYVQGLQPREIVDDSLGKKYIVNTTKELDHITRALREWGVCVPPYTLSTSNFFMAIGVALTLPIQCKFLQVFKTPLGIHYFFRPLQTIVVCVRWLHEISVWDYHVVIVLPNTELETFVAPT